MSRPADIAAAIRELFRNQRFKGTWNMLASGAVGERSAALEAVKRSLDREGLTFLDLADAITNGRETIRNVSHENRIEVPADNQFRFSGFITPLGYLDVANTSREFAGETLLKVRIGTPAFHLEPVLIHGMPLVEQALSLAKHKQRANAHVIVSPSLKIEGRSCCFLKEFF